MEKVTLSQMATWMHAEITADLGTQEVGVSTDSRNIKRGDVFFALCGPHFDGHDFVMQALEQGASAAVVSRRWWRESGTESEGSYLVVDDPLEALQKLAAAYRGQFDPLIVAVTGTNGKTTTKELVANVLAKKFVTWRSPGNFNNHIGVPLSLLGLSSEHEVAVLEMGMNHPGEIRNLAKLARPEMGIITNVGPAHLEFMGTMEEVAKAKLELLEELPPKGRAILNADDPRLMGQQVISRDRVITFGIHQEADYRATELKTSIEETSFVVDGEELVLPVVGRYNISNALAAVAAGREMGVAWRDIADALLRYHPLSSRMEIIELEGMRIINDAYNANPASTKAAIEAVKELEGVGRKIVILGEMWELGEQSNTLHRKVGKSLVTSNFDLLITVGERAKPIAQGAIAAGFPQPRVKSFGDVTETVAFLRRSLTPNDLILIKGSRGMRMERIVDELRRS